MKKVIGPTLAAIVMLGLLVGCEAPLPQSIQYNSEMYKQAYMDGRSSGHRACGSIYHQFKKEVGLYINEPRYKTGWDDGFQQAKAVHSLRGCP